MAQTNLCENVRYVKTAKRFVKEGYKSSVISLRLGLQFAITSTQAIAFLTFFEKNVVGLMGYPGIFGRNV